jgi:hypothetical protein
MNRLYKIGLTPTGNKGTNHPFEVDFSWGVAGVLKAYDLPDLIGCIAPGKVAIAAPVDHELKIASDDLINREMAFARRVYDHKGAAGNIRLSSSKGYPVELVDWCFK